MTDAVGTRTFAYNSALRPDTENLTGLISRTLTRAYDTTDVPGRNTGFSTDSSYAVTYGYDNTGRFNGVSWNIGTHTDTVQYGYEPNSHLLQSAAFASGASSTYTFEPQRNLKTSVQNKYNSTAVSQYDYTHDNIGRRNSMTTTGDAFSVSLPVPPDQKLVNTGTYTSVGYTANDLNQYTSLDTNGSAVSPTYDEDGSLTDDGTFSYTWNGENRLITVTPKTPAVGDKKLEFLYDYMGRRARKITTAWDGSSWQADETRFFVYDGWNLIEELDVAGATTASYVHGLDLSQSLQGAGGIGGILARIDHGASKVHVYLYDANGNVGQLVDAADGSIVAAYEYAPFGGLTSSMGTYAEVNPFRFSSKYADDVAGLYYYGYRYYFPELGRWMSRDPIGEDGGLNLYGFVGNSPLVYFDPYGMSVSEDFGSFAEGAGEGAFNMAYESLATVYDAEQYVFYTIVADPDKYQATSAIGKAREAGAGIGEIAGGMAIGLAMVPVEYVEAIISGNPKRIGEATFNLEAFLYAGSKIKLNSSVKYFITAQTKSFIEGSKKACSFLIRREVYVSGIKTPYGVAKQSVNRTAQAARQSVRKGGLLYRGGTLGRSAGPEGQFWSLENPMSPGYAKKYGIPAENMNFDFVEVARLKNGVRFITREAPGIGSNTGGGIEVVTPPNAVELDYFYMP